ncbi:MAG: recombinase family protein [Clostridia bacterium]|nr:recombinase family protein [Clostridia bacterium]
MSMQKAVIYARNTNKRYIDGQVQHLLSYCDCENLDVVGIVRDKRNGKNIRRWRLRKAERLAKRKQADFIVMINVSRISRSVLNVIKYRDIIKENGIKLKFSDDEITNEQFEQISGVTHRMFL